MTYVVRLLAVESHDLGSLFVSAGIKCKNKLSPDSFFYMGVYFLSHVPSHYTVICPIT